jgi:hypothetical protein
MIPNGITLNLRQIEQKLQGMLCTVVKEGCENFVLNNWNFENNFENIFWTNIILKASCHRTRAQLINVTNHRP